MDKSGTIGNDVIKGGGGNDNLFGLSGNDLLFGGDGHDMLTGGAGADGLDGGSLSDIASYLDSPAGVVVDLSTGLGFGGDAEGDRLYSIEGVYGSNFNDTLTGRDDHDFLKGFGGNDILRGAGGADSMWGGNGDDTLKGGGGADDLHGEAGSDTVNYNDSPTRVFVSLRDNVAAYGDAEGDTFVSIERISGSAYNDALWGDDGVNGLNGMAGNDSLKGFGGSDNLRGEAGDDYLDGGADADSMAGGPGNDTYIADNIADWAIELANEGVDVVRTSIDYALYANLENLETTDPNGTRLMFLNGNSSSNSITGNNGENYINGQGGADQMTGLGGSDFYFVDNAGDVVNENGGQGYDQVTTTVSWRLTPGSDVEVLEADYYTASSISLTGNANGNVVRGNNGNNTINGGDGRDQLTGLAGQDGFLFNTPLNAASNVDVITDFNVADDTILLDNAVFASSLGLGYISAGEFVIGTAAQDANDRIIYNSSTGALFYDNDGVGGNAQVQFAALRPGLALTNLDFLVVTGTQIPFEGGRLLIDEVVSTDVETDIGMTETSPGTVEYVDSSVKMGAIGYLV
jgi:Ca2+-binding RTX toxin-like protein